MDVQVSIDTDDEGVSITAQYGLPVATLVFLAFMVPLQALALWAHPIARRWGMLALVAFADASVVLFAYVARPKKTSLRVTSESLTFDQERRWGIRIAKTVPISKVAYVRYRPSGRYSPNGMSVGLYNRASRLFLIAISESDVDGFKAEISAKFPELVARWRQAEPANDVGMVSLNLQ